MDHKKIQDILKEHQIVCKDIPEIVCDLYKGSWCVKLKENIGVHKYGKTPEEAEFKFWKSIAELLPSLEEGERLGKLRTPMKKKLAFLHKYFIYQGEPTNNYKPIFPEEILAKAPKWREFPVLTKEDLENIKWEE